MSRSERPGQPETETVCKLETGKHYPVWNNGGWRRQPLSTPFPEPGHPVPSVLGCLPPSMGAQASPPAAWPGSHLTLCPPWTSPGPWEEAAPPTCLPFSPATPTREGDPGPRCAAGSPGGPLSAPPRAGLQHPTHKSPRGFPRPPSTLLSRGLGGAAGYCAVSPNPHLPPEPRPSPPQRETRAEPGVLTPPYTHS